MRINSHKGALCSRYTGRRIKSHEDRLSLTTRCVGLRLDDVIRKYESWAWCHGLAAKVLALNAPGSHMGAGLCARQLHFPSSSLLVPWEGSQGQPKALGPCIRVGDLEEVLGSWLWIGSAPAIAVTLGVNHRMKDLPL